MISTIHVKISILTVLFLTFIGCTSRYDGELRKMNLRDQINIDFNDKTKFKSAEFVYSNGIRGEHMTVRELKNVYGIDLYLDTLDNIRKVQVRRRNCQDDIQQILEENKGYNPSKGVPVIEFKCDSVLSLYKGIYDKTPEDFSEIIGIDTLGYSSFQRAIIQGIVKSCGLPNTNGHSKRSVELFFDFIHHSEKDLMAYYFPFFEKLYLNGDLNSKRFSVMTDRLLAWHDFDQVYGSQILNSKLYPIRNIDSVNYRRKEIGMQETLEEYLENFDLIN